MGFLYTRLSLIEPANHAFKIVQAMKPSHSSAWIGQALVADMYGMEEEAGDLFRHASELAQEPEGDAGYGTYSQRFITDVQLRSANAHLHVSLPAATTALGRFVVKEPHDPTALNVYGLLLELQGLFSLSERALSNSLRVLELLLQHAAKDDEAQSFKKDPRFKVWGNHFASSKTELELHIVKVKTNLARVQLKLGLVDQSYSLLSPISTDESSCRDPYILASVGRVFFEKCNWKDSLVWYKKSLDVALSSLSSSTLKKEDPQYTIAVQFISSLYVTLALCSYRSQDMETAKSFIFAW